MFAGAFSIYAMRHRIGMPYPIPPSHKVNRVKSCGRYNSTVSHHLSLSKWYGHSVAVATPLHKGLCITIHRVKKSFQNLSHIAIVIRRQRYKIGKISVTFIMRNHGRGRCPGSCDVFIVQRSLHKGKPRSIGMFPITQHSTMWSTVAFCLINCCYGKQVSVNSYIRKPFQNVGQIAIMERTLTHKTQIIISYRAKWLEGQVLRQGSFCICAQPMADDVTL